MRQCIEGQLATMDSAANLRFRHSEKSDFSRDQTPLEWYGRLDGLTRIPHVT